MKKQVIKFLAIGSLLMAGHAANAVPIKVGVGATEAPTWGFWSLSGADYFASAFSFASGGTRYWSFDADEGDYWFFIAARTPYYGQLGWAIWVNDQLADSGYGGYRRHLVVGTEHFHAVSEPSTLLLLLGALLSAGGVVGLRRRRVRALTQHT